VEKRINIQKYGDFFHDGRILKIQHNKDKISFALESAEIDLDDISDNLPLSTDDRLRGRLHLDRVLKILLNGKEFKGRIEMQYNHTSIYSLDMDTKIVRLFFCWEVYPVSSSLSLTPVNLEIYAKRIYWEPVPDMVDPYW
jgi:hypothetical protein